MKIPFVHRYWKDKCKNLTDKNMQLTEQIERLKEEVQQLKIDNANLDNRFYVFSKITGRRYKEIKDYDNIHED